MVELRMEQLVEGEPHNELEIHMTYADNDDLTGEGESVYSSEEERILDSDAFDDQEHSQITGEEESCNDSGDSDRSDDDDNEDDDADSDEDKLDDESDEDDSDIGAEEDSDDDALPLGGVLDLSKSDLDDDDSSAAESVEALNIPDDTDEEAEEERVKSVDDFYSSLQAIGGSQSQGGEEESSEQDESESSDDEDSGDEELDATGGDEESVASEGDDDSISILENNAMLANMMSNYVQTSAVHSSSKRGRDMAATSETFRPADLLSRADPFKRSRIGAKINRDDSDSDSLANDNAESQNDDSSDDSDDEEEAALREEIKKYVVMP